MKKILLAKQHDRHTTIQTVTANSLAQRVVGLLQYDYPVIIEHRKSILKHIEHIEQQYGINSWLTALHLAMYMKDTFKDIGLAIKAGFAYSTGGIVSAPLEGITNIECEEYMHITVAGPIRNAGGTASAMMVLLADFISQKPCYVYDTKEKQAIIDEVYAYHNDVTRLQYVPSPQELAMLLDNIPVKIDGTSTNILKDGTSIRGGLCLLISAGFCLKAPKLVQLLDTTALPQDFVARWNFLRDVKPTKQKATTTYMSDMIGGRPLFGTPSHSGAFRLRYGRTRHSGYSATAIHPLTMYACDKFLATGTQLRLQLPSKSTVVTPCDSIRPPFCLFEDGSAGYMQDKQQKIKRIMYLGDLLVSYGDFFDRAYPLQPVGYCEEWWQQETQHTGVQTYSEAKHIAITTQTALHPAYTPYWNVLSDKQVYELHVMYAQQGFFTIDTQEYLLALAIPHHVQEEVIILSDDFKALFDDIFGQPPLRDVLLSDTLRTTISNDTQSEDNTIHTGLTYVRKISPYHVQDTLGTTIGARMGRPEKAKPRKVTLHGLSNDAHLPQLALQHDCMLYKSESKTGVSEDPIKTVLRAIHNVSCFKDGTIRYDATQVPLTHFTPKEIGCSLSQLKKMGYTQDYKQQPLTQDTQLVVLQAQDIILPACSQAHFIAITQFIDALVVHYGQQPLYKVKTPKQLIGQAIVGLAPHTSVGIQGRIIGFSQTATLLAHPYFHAAMRRDCDGDETSIMLLYDVLLNFNIAFIPNTRGSKMDVPLVLQTLLDPTQVDDMVGKMENVTTYPLSLYTQQQAQVTQVKQSFAQEILFTHNLTDINQTNDVCVYKTIPTMQEKVEAQLALAHQIDAVDEKKLAQAIVEKHWLKDIQKNFETYFTQHYRSTQYTYRRPLLGMRDVKGQHLQPTVTKAAIIKYLKPAQEIAKRYGLQLPILDRLAEEIALSVDVWDVQKNE
ncbi:MAG: hypothetical protein ACMXYC_03595 [Candidatus Woesearchaeota archaeon]